MSREASERRAFPLIDVAAERKLLRVLATSGPDPFRHHKAVADKHGAFGSDAFGVMAEKIARFMGTAQYLVGQTVFVAVWIAVNAVAAALRWDPFPFILLNLLFSTQAAYAAPMILLAQTRQADRDKAAEKADALHREEIAQRHGELLQENTALTQQVQQQTAVLQQLAVEISVIRQALAPALPAAAPPGTGPGNG